MRGRPRLSVEVLAARAAAKAEHLKKICAARDAIHSVPSHRGGSSASGALYRAAIDWLQLRPSRLAFVYARISPCPITGCWWWTGTISDAGYGRIAIAQRYLVAHRLVYALTFGVPPDDLECDHLCRQRGCVNPWHLDLVTRLENVRRSAICHPDLQVAA